MSINNVTLMGRITSEPELKTTGNGNSVTSFNVAVDRNYSSNGQRTTDFIPVVCWRKTAEFVCKYFGKGSLIALTGTITSRSYQDKTGNNRTSIEVQADNVSFTGEKHDVATPPQNQGQQQYKQQSQGQQTQRQGGYQQNANSGYPNGGTNNYQNAPQQSAPQNAPAQQDDEFEDLPWNDSDLPFG